MTQKSTIVRFLSGSLQALELVAPELAARWARRLFFTPGRRKAQQNEQRVLHEAARFELAVGQRTVRGYAWGRGRPVLLVHGWGGYSAQFAELVPALLARGHRVLALDFPAHGSSAGGTSNVFEFRAALLELGRREGAFHAIVGHSLGAMAVALAVRSGLAVDRAVLVAPMTSFTFAVDAFSRELGLSPRLKTRATKSIVERFVDEDVELELVRSAGDMRLPLLVIHDEDDRRVPTQLGRDLAAAWPRARYAETRGLGHKRILSDPEIVQQIAEFVTASASYRWLPKTRSEPAALSPELVRAAS